MLKNLLKFSWVLLIPALTFITSCENETSEELATEIENYVDNSVSDLKASSRSGKKGCFELVFPIEIELPNGDVVSADSFEELRAIIKDWKENNPDVDVRPQLVFPIEVVLRNGDVISLNSHEEIKRLIHLCKDNRPDRPGDRDFCFKPVYPLTLVFPDGTSQEVANRMELKMAVRAWKADNPDSDERPTLGFPLDVVLADGTTVTLNDADELEALKQSCQDD
jgi:hypothetical protein